MWISLAMLDTGLFLPYLCGGMFEDSGGIFGDLDEVILRSCRSEIIYFYMYNHFECENKFMRDIPVSIPWVLLWEHIPAHTRHGWCDWLQTWLSLYCGCFLQTHSSNNSDNLQSSKLSLHVQLNFNQPRIDREKFRTTRGHRRTINHPLNVVCTG